jgi:membrane peptidoglycan carboxypeptidase
MNRRTRLGLATTIVMAAALGAAAIVAWPRWVATRDTANAMVDAHVALEATHPGWSFPARLWSDSSAIEQPKARLLAQARARGYRELCPPAAPGDICPKTGDVLLRGGEFPEGRQPPGNTGWTRPLALEPVYLGGLVGPDAELREHLPREEAPAALIAAITAAEDEDFWTHHGVNVRGTVRAAWVNLTGGQQQGASTLTMQVVRNLSRDTERSMARKVREAASAVAIDDHLGKEGVLQMYLDAPYLGQSGGFSVCGFQAAARYYWGIEARDLSLAQAATLAAILPAPGRYSPESHPEEAKVRRDRLLRRMATLGWDTAAVDAAIAEPMGATPHAPAEGAYPAYQQATRTWLLETLPEATVYGAGLEVWTALDVAAQVATDVVIPEKVTFLERNVGRNGKAPLGAAAALLDTASGLLVAVHDGRMVGPTDFNRATQTRRQSGSSIKPLIYGLALSRLGDDGHPALTAAHTLPNTPRTFPNTNGWRPLNVGNDYSPTSTLAMGLSWSQNIVAASLLEESGGPSKLVPFAERFGFDTRAWPHEMGLALGQAEVNPLEMARFVATIARGGELASARPVITAVDAAGRVRVPPVERGERVIPQESAAILRDLMRLVTTYGTAYTIKGVGGEPGFTSQAMGKTGTADDEKDLWFIGATPRYASAVWLGYDTPARVGGTAGDLASPLWGWWMRALHDGSKPEEFGEPVLERRPICTQTGLYGNASCRIINAPFLPGTAPKGSCTTEHPPKPPDEKPFENLWQRKTRLAEERAAAGG